MSIFIGPAMTLEQLVQMRNQMQAQMAQQAAYQSAQNARMDPRFDYVGRDAAMDMVLVDGVWMTPEDAQERGWIKTPIGLVR